MWANFFVAAAGASAALAGLVFVALSVNIERVLKFPALPARAAATIGNLMLILVSSMASLMPQSPHWMGIEILAFTAIAFLLQFDSDRRAIAASLAGIRPKKESVVSTTLGLAQLTPFVAGALLLMGWHSSGAYWVAAGILAIFAGSTFNAWILLVEILR